MKDFLNRIDKGKGRWLIGVWKNGSRSDGC